MQLQNKRPPGNTMALKTILAMFPIMISAHAHAAETDGDWTYHFTIEGNKAACAAFARPGTLSIDDGRVTGSIPYLFDDFKITGSVGNTITGTWEYDGVVFIMYVDVVFANSKAVGSWSLPDLGCKGQATLVPAGTRMEPTVTRPAIQQRLSELKDLLDRGLITEEEATEKRREILKDL